MALAAPPSSPSAPDPALPHAMSTATLESETRTILSAYPSTPVLVAARPHANAHNRAESSAECEVGRKKAAPAPTRSLSPAAPSRAWPPSG